MQKFISQYIPRKFWRTKNKIMEYWWCTSFIETGQHVCQTNSPVRQKDPIVYIHYFKRLIAPARTVPLLRAGLFTATLHTNTTIFYFILPSTEHCILYYPIQNTAHHITQYRTLNIILPNTEHCTLYYPIQNTAHYITQYRTLHIILPNTEHCILYYPIQNTAHYITQYRTLHIIYY
jgi:hypothetical protein